MKKDYFRDFLVRSIDSITAQLDKSPSPSANFFLCHDLSIYKNLLAEYDTMKEWSD